MFSLFLASQSPSVRANRLSIDKHGSKNRELRYACHRVLRLRDVDPESAIDRVVQSIVGLWHFCQPIVEAGTPLNSSLSLKF